MSQFVAGWSRIGYADLPQFAVFGIVERRQAATRIAASPPQAACKGMIYNEKAEDESLPLSYPLRETNLLGDYIVYQYVPVFVIILGSRKDRALFSPYFLHYLCFTA